MQKIDRIINKVDNPNDKLWDHQRIGCVSVKRSLHGECDLGSLVAAKGFCVRFGKISKQVGRISNPTILSRARLMRDVSPT